MVVGLASLLNLKSDWRRALTLHHLANLLLCLSFYVTKTVEPLCSLLLGRQGDECAISIQDHQILVFLAFVIFWKNRKATSWFHYVSNVFVFAKLANIVLFFRTEPRAGILFGVLCMLITVLLPEPAYKGPEQVTYFRGPGLADELRARPGTVWLVEFYVAWSPECQQVASVFAQLSEAFALPNLRFAKLDVGKFPEEAERFRVNAHPTSRQLPTFALFKGGKEFMRRPVVNAKGRAVTYTFTEENVIIDFDLRNLHKDCQDRLSKHHKQQQDKEKKDE